MRSNYTRACDHHNPRHHHCSCYSSLSQSRIGPGHRKHNHVHSDGGYHNRDHQQSYDDTYLCLYWQQLNPLHHRRSCVCLSCSSSHPAFTFSSSFISSSGALLPLLPQAPPHPLLRSLPHPSPLLPLLPNASCAIS